MPITPPSLDDLYQTGKTALTALGFNNWSEGSAINAIMKVMAGYLADQWSVLADLETQTNPAEAKGIYLDRFGAQFGVPRLPPQAASTIGSGPAVRFTNNGSSTYTVPANTRVWNAGNPDIAFFTDGSLVVAAGAQGFVDATAVTAGDTYNIGVGQLNSHNAGSQVTVTNIRPIGGGSFFETDDAYRFRISQALQAKNGATSVAIRQALLQVPGVRDALIYPGIRGNGSVDVLVIPIDTNASSDLLANCEDAVSNTIAAGISWRVMPPKTRRIDLAIQLNLAGGAVLAQAQALVTAALLGYVNNLRVNDGNGGSDFIYNIAVARVLDSSPDILDASINVSVDSVAALQTNFSPNPGERVIAGSITVS